MKTHLQANKGIDRAPFALCASRPSAFGKVRFNSRSTYLFMDSPIVRIAEFKILPAAERCAHCDTLGLALRNRQRAAKGKPPVMSICD